MTTEKIILARPSERRGEVLFSHPFEYILPMGSKPYIYLAPEGETIRFGRIDDNGKIHEATIPASRIKRPEGNRATNLESDFTYRILDPNITMFESSTASEERDKAHALEEEIKEAQGFLGDIQTGPALQEADDEAWKVFEENCKHG